MALSKQAKKYKGYSTFQLDWCTYLQLYHHTHFKTFEVYVVLILTAAQCTMYMYNVHGSDNFGLHG